jgi:hypothetical protein
MELFGLESVRIPEGLPISNGETFGTDLAIYVDQDHPVDSKYHCNFQCTRGIQHLEHCNYAELAALFPNPHGRQGV